MAEVMDSTMLSRWKHDAWTSSLLHDSARTPTKFDVVYLNCLAFDFLHFTFLDAPRQPGTALDNRLGMLSARLTFQRNPPQAQAIRRLLGLSYAMSYMDGCIDT